MDLAWAPPADRLAWALPAALVTLVAAVLAAEWIYRGVPAGLSRMLGITGVVCGGTGFAVTLALAPPAGVAARVPLSLGATLGSLLATVVLLRLAGAGDRGAASRGLLDGALVGACGYYVLWELVLRPGHRDFLARTPAARLLLECALLSVPVAATLLALGTAIVLVGRAGTRTVVAPAAATVVATSLLGTAGTFAVRYAGPVALVACALGYAAVLLGLGRLAPWLARHPRRMADPTGRPTILVGLIPVLAVLVAGAVRRGLWGPLDAVGIGLLLAIAALVSARQAATVLQLRRVLGEYRHQALTDPLTGLANRRGLLDALGGGGDPGSLIASSLVLVDLDGFKAVNDIHGHDAGDTVLVEVARRLRTALPPGSLVARLGGDEFAVLLPVPADQAGPVAGGLRAALEAPYRVGPGEVYLSASLGLAGREPDDEPTAGTVGPPARMLARADVALRFAKQRGKNRVEGYALADALWLRRRTRVEQELRGAAARGELSLVFQPVMRLPSGLPVGVETLLRWRHPELGVVSPEEFIPIAEEAGLVGALDRWVLHEVCHQLADWVADGYDLWVAVNISVRELHQPGYVPRVLNLLEAHALPPSRLVLEITEHAVALDPDEVSARLAELRELGVRVALDDFGAGYSSLGRLRTFPVDIVKIDRALLVDPLLDISVQLAQRLGKQVVAEGIADAESRAAVQRAGCPLGQGSALCPPVPADQVTALLTPVGRVPVQRRAQHAGQVDSSREMRQS